MYWVLLWYSAQSHLDEVLIQIGALKKCHDKMIVKAMEIVIATPFGKNTRFGQSSWKRRRRLWCNTCKGGRGGLTETYGDGVWAVSLIIQLRTKVMNQIVTVRTFFTRPVEFCQFLRDFSKYG